MLTNTAVCASVHARIFAQMPQQTMRYYFFFFITLATAMILPSHALYAGESHQRPNIVFILADDIGYKDVGFQGAKFATPNIDTLAKGGVVFKNFYSLPVCTQSRVALLAGVFPHRMNLHNRVIKRDSKKAIPQDVELFPERLKSLGYQTAISGKWHLGHHSKEVRPLARGFDYQFGNYCGFIEYYNHFYKGKPDLWKQGELNKRTGYSTHLFAEEAINFLESAEKLKPVFLYLPFTAAHATLEAPKEAIKRNSFIKNKKKRLFAAVVTEMDKAIGQVIDKLKELDRFDNTLIFFSSDNGANTRFGGNNGEFQSGKGELYEGGIRVPTVLYYPKKFKAQTNRTVARLVDIAPTLYSLIGTSGPTYLDGTSLLNELSSSSPENAPDSSPSLKERSVLLAYSRTGIAVRNGNYKAIEDIPNHIAALYNIESDPGESKNLASENKALFETLIKEAKAQADGITWKQDSRKKDMKLSEK